jgi:hypothetical protein
MALGQFRLMRFRCDSRNGEKPQGRLNPGTTKRLTNNCFSPQKDNQMKLIFIAFGLLLANDLSAAILTIESIGPNTCRPDFTITSAETQTTIRLSNEYLTPSFPQRSDCTARVRGWVETSGPERSGFLEISSMGENGGSVFAAGPVYSIFTNPIFTRTCVSVRRWPSGLQPGNPQS